MQLLDGLDPSQQDAVTSDAAPLCILAGAGSGKTRVLTRRIAHRVLTHSAEASRVLALTFTRKAAGELRGRLEHLGVRDQVAAGTFHAIAYAQLRRRWADRGERAPTLLTSKVRLLAPLLPRARAGDCSPLVQPADLAAEIEWAKARMVPPPRYEAEAEAAGRRAQLPAATMAAIYERYENDKRRKGLVDFEDLLLSYVHALENDKEFAAGQRWRYRHFFVDEFQDVNPVQFRLVTAWLGDRLDLCVVGDPNQAIYSWNGADPTFLTELRLHFPGAQVVRLDHNHRSTPQVVAAAAAVLAPMPELSPTPGPRTGPRIATVTATRADGPLPVVRRFDTDVAEARGIARALRRAHRPGVPWRHLAVLARTNAQLSVLAEHLRAGGVPCRLSGDGALLHQPEVKDAVSQLLRAPPGMAFSSRLSDVESLAAQAGDDEKRLNLDTLVRLGQDYAALDPAASADGFVAWLRAGGHGDQPDAGAEAVELTTFHRAKGLEWPVVVVAGLENGLVPIGHAHTAEAEAEEQRLLHVALTRAIDELTCTWAERRTFGTRTLSRNPSPYLHLVETAVAAMTPGQEVGPDEMRSRVRAQKERLRASGRRGGHSPGPGSNPDPQVLDALKAWRSATARASGVPAYVIFHDATLAAMAEVRPTTPSQLLALPGLGPVKAERYGPALLALLAEVTEAAMASPRS